MSGIISSTPIWLFFIFSIAAAYCVTFCFEKSVNVKSASLIPMFFLILSWFNLLQQEKSYFAILMWLLGAVIGGRVANTIFGTKNYRLGKKEGTVTVSGTYSIIIIFLFYFPLRYYIGYSQETAYDHHLSHPLIILLAISSGGVVGFFTLRSYIIFRQYKKLICERPDS